VTERAPSGRVQAIDIKTDVGVVRLQKDEIVRVLSAPRSLLFYVDPLYLTPDNEAKANGDSQGGAATNPDLVAAVPPKLTGYRFVGGGWGHGVGMSQTGSYNLGRLGWSYDRILQFYYPGTTLQPINDALVFWRDPLEE